MNFPVLTIITFLPLFGAGLIFFFMKGDEALVAQNAKFAGVWTSAITFILSISLLFYDMGAHTGTYFLVEEAVWLPAMGVTYKMAVDGLALPFILLTTLLTPLCVLVSWKGVTKHTREFIAALLALESFVIGVFCAADLVLFYVFWEALLIPMFLIIGVWGGEQRIYAALKFFLYTFVGSVLMLVALMYMYSAGPHTFDLLALGQTAFSIAEQKWLWLAFFAAFAVKVPMWPFHTWLPDAHVQAPTAGSVILAGVLLKLGAYGFLRLSLPLFPDASAYFAPMVFTLSAIAVLYTALVALMQKDIKKLIAYSSVSHMGFITLGIFAATPESLQGAILQMVNHGLVAAALFMLIGVIYDRMHTRDLARFGGLVQVMPLYSAFFVLFTMASIALPGTSSFVGEFLILLGSFGHAQYATFFSAFGVVLGAAYMLWLVKRMIFGTPKTAEVKALEDMNLREVFMFLPLLTLVVIFGLYPSIFFKITEPTVMALTAQLAEKGYYQSLSAPTEHEKEQTTHAH